ncbi:porin family protein [Phenylobacterium sp.]|uniref:porin family protein n=1 Tax=Phenylobacterium sp. TaxID=1871053 RepID=UPI00391D5C9C
MKALFAAASVAALVCVVPAVSQAQPLAQSITNGRAYGSLGYAQTDGSGVDLGSIQGRLGYRFNNWVGVEGEGAFGVKDDDVTIAGTDVNVDLKHQFAGYVVGFAPVGANTDLIARFGYGTTKIKGSAGGISASDDGESWNYGLGAQHHFDGVNGVRIDWTRHDFDGGNADVWSVAYTRKF